MSNRKLSSTVIITGCNTDNPNFQWYGDRIGDKFEVVRVLNGENGQFIVHPTNTNGTDYTKHELEWYRVLGESNIWEYIHKSDCQTIEEYREGKLESIGI